MHAKQWPNGIGWDISTRHGIAEVRDCVKFLRCFAPIRPRLERAVRLKTGEPFIRSVEQYRRADFPIGTDPVACVRATLTTGNTHEV